MLKNNFLRQNFLNRIICCKGLFIELQLNLSIHRECKETIFEETSHTKVSLDFTMEERKWFV
jgi:hypothetical protein